MRLSLGISTCPNDTYAFHGLLTGAVELEDLGLAFDITLHDVEELNTRFAKGAFDVAKLSFAAMLRQADELVVLPVGAALGFGVGPVVLARPGFQGPLDATTRVLAPGANTTASLLWRRFHPELGEPDQVVFHEIMPALARGDADLGVCIHEGRFTYAEAGLSLFEDLGAVWEGATGAPLPLGGIAARRALGADVIGRVAQAIRRSLAVADADPDATAATMARHAQDQSRASHFKHVELYVNAWTRDLAHASGPAALAALSPGHPGARLELVGFDGQPVGAPS